MLPARLSQNCHSAAYVVVDAAEAKVLFVSDAFEKRMGVSGVKAHVRDSCKLCQTSSFSSYLFLTSARALICSARTHTVAPGNVILAKSITRATHVQMY
jgi:hypothetical protein